MKRRLQTERGVVAIEMSIVLVLGIFLLASVLVLGRLTWHAIVMQKAISSAGRIVGALPFETITTSGVSGAINAIAASHVDAATQSAGLDIQPDPDLTMVDCVDAGRGGCGRTIVTFIAASSYLRFSDTIFGNSMTGLLPEAGLDLDVTYFQTYVP